MPLTSLHHAIFPLAGQGKRLWPLTKTTPKAMISVADIPILGWSIHEAYCSGIKHFIFIIDDTSFGQQIRNYLAPKASRQPSPYPEPMATSLTAASANALFIVQEQPLGLGDAVRKAKNHVNGQDVAILLVDDLILGDTPCLSQMITKRRSELMIAAEKINPLYADHYGILATKDSLDPNDSTPDLIALRGVVEKPKLDCAPSSYAIVGRYILPYGVFGRLDQAKPGLNGEIQITDSLDIWLRQHSGDALLYQGIRHDCGRMDGLVAAQAAARTHIAKLENDHK